VKISTRKFGEIEIDETKILTMPEGLPGFPGFERFVLLEDKVSAPFIWFQSIEEPNLSLVLINPFLFKPDYIFDLQEAIQVRSWKKVDEKELVIYVVVNISGGKKDKEITANLMGPLVINSKNNEVIQLVLSDSDYSYQYDVLDAL